MKYDGIEDRRRNTNVKNEKERHRSALVIRDRKERSGKAQVRNIYIF
jgi:hypothetical protein